MHTLSRRFLLTVCLGWLGVWLLALAPLARAQGVQTAPQPQPVPG